MPDLTRLRWCLYEPGVGYRAAEEIVNEGCTPAVDDLLSLGHADSLYVSKHGPSEVWFTVFSDGQSAIDVISTVEPYLQSFSSRSQHTADLSKEEMLQSHCKRFRRGLDLVTRIALDVHRSTELEHHQKALIKVGHLNRRDRSLLQPYLQERSSTFRSLSDPEELWGVLGCNCLSVQRTDCLHWLYNIVLGFDWRWDMPEVEIAEHLGLSWP